jgi:predicted glutamine amidotransferase
MVRMGLIKQPSRIFVILITCALSAIIALPTALAQPHVDSMSPHNCRLWGIVSGRAPASAILDQLLCLPQSLDSLSLRNPHGWGIAYYADTTGVPVVARGELPAYADSLFDSAAIQAAGISPRVAVAHIRYCTSGLCNIPNPHPFLREKNSRHWLFAHNGTIDKGVLLSLIRPEYLAANPVQYGANISEWIDSDLYQIYILQTLEDHQWQMKPALGHVIQQIRTASQSWYNQLNFFLTDGTSLWAYCEGNTLYYTSANGDSAYSAVASQYPGSVQGDWIQLVDGQLVTLKPDVAPELENIESYFDGTAVGDYNTLAGTNDRKEIDLFQNQPNPFNASTRISFYLVETANVLVEIFNISGQKIQILIDGILSPGLHSIIWDGYDLSGKPVASGIYIYRLRLDNSVLTRRMLLLK